MRSLLHALMRIARALYGRSTQGERSCKLEQKVRVRALVLFKVRYNTMPAKCPHAHRERHFVRSSSQTDVKRAR